METLGLALRLLTSLDAELASIVGLSLYVSLSATGIAAVIGVPLGALLAITVFPGRQLLIVLTNTLSDRTMQLTLHQHWAQDGPGVVDADHAVQGDVTRLGVHGERYGHAADPADLGLALARTRLAGARLGS